MRYRTDSTESMGGLLRLIVAAGDILTEVPSGERLPQRKREFGDDCTGRGNEDQPCSGNGATGLTCTSPIGLTRIREIAFELEEELFVTVPAQECRQEEDRQGPESMERTGQLRRVHERCQPVLGQQILTNGV
jgi:hypothetical protein